MDAKGRLKIPTTFRAHLEERFGRLLYVTSVRGDFVRIYPMPVWIQLEEKLSRLSVTHPSRARFADRVSYYGQVSEIDGQGRVTIHARLREAADMRGEVDVFGQYTFLDVWNHERFVSRLEREPFSDDDARALADLGI
jgi:MraZ protein